MIILDCGCEQTTERGHVHTKLCPDHLRRALTRGAEPIVAMNGYETRHYAQEAAAAGIPAWDDIEGC